MTHIAPHRRKSRAPRLADVDLTGRLSLETYEARLAEAQRCLREIALSLMHQKGRAIIVLEGWDAAGKGGLIRRMSWALDPRAFKVWPIGPPDEHERQHHYLYRFWRRLPEHGAIAVFDRSWYGRVLVERVEGLTPRKNWMRAYDEINEFERLLTDDGYRIAKIFLHVSVKAQLHRFERRMNDPMKRWKLTTADMINIDKRGLYEKAIGEMLRKTSTEQAPWRVIGAEQKQFGRVAAMEAIVDQLGNGLDLTLPALDPDVEEMLRARLGVSVA